MTTEPIIQPILNTTAADRTREAYGDFAKLLDDHINDVRIQLTALIQAKNSLERLFHGGRADSLQADLSTISVAMREAEKQVKQEA